MDKSWLSKERQSSEYINGVEQFIEYAFRGPTLTDNEGNLKIRCPCLKCNNVLYQVKEVVTLHLLRKGIVSRYKIWTCHGEKKEALYSARPIFRNIEEMQEIVSDITGARAWSTDEDASNEEAESFYRLLGECEKSLYPSCTEYSKMSYIVELLHIKCLYKISNSGICKLIEFFKKCLPPENVAPSSYQEAKKIVSDLGLGYKKIDSCKNDCVLFYKENADADVCPICKESRWVQPKQADNDPTTKGIKKIRKKVAVKILRYFPLKSRLKRCFMSDKTAASMRWHDDGRIKDGILRHPADTKAWKTLDNVRPSFGAEPRNVRLGFASDGFNPFSNKPYSMWPVILIPYNLPPNECMRDPNYFLSMIIPGPTSPGNNIDVYLQPLIDELKELWEDGVRAYDASRKENFQLYAAILWTINDLPAYGNLSGWSTSGYLACPVCQMETCSNRLEHGHKQCFMGHRRFLQVNHPFRTNKGSFDGHQEHRLKPKRPSGGEVLAQLEQLEDIPFGKTQKDLKIFGVDSPTGNWKKKSIFFNLPYWMDLILPHNLDVMHIEKNVCENIMNILLGVGGRSNDNLNARKDMQEMGIRRALHPIPRGAKTIIPPASYTLTSEEKTTICQFLRDLTLPGGFSSNISHCVKVKERKISGLKSHDYHVLMQRLLPIAVRGVLPKPVSDTLIKLSRAFNLLCAKELRVTDLEQLELDLPIIMCNLERIFPPAFFNITVHLVIHLVEEAIMGGPVQFRWMYFIERLMGVMKSFVRNRRYPEASIAEGFIAMECANFCSRYLHGIETRFTRSNQNSIVEGLPYQGVLDIFCSVGRPLSGSVLRRLSLTERSQCHLYILRNCDKVQPYIDEHKRMQQRKRKNPRNLVLEHNIEFADWFENRVAKLNHAQASMHDKQMQALGRKPLFDAKSYSGYEVNGFKFHTIERTLRRTVQNCGVFVSAGTMCFSSGRDKNPIYSLVDYYGIVTEVVEVQYRNPNRVVLFKCDWYDVLDNNNTKHDEYGFTWVRNTKFMRTTEPFILASQARQVFYAKDPVDRDWSLVVTVDPRKQFNMGLHMLDEGVEPFQEISSPHHQVHAIGQDIVLDDDFECNRLDGFGGVEIDTPNSVDSPRGTNEYRDEHNCCENEEGHGSDHENEQNNLFKNEEDLDSQDDTDDDMVDDNIQYEETDVDEGSTSEKSNDE